MTTYHIMPAAGRWEVTQEGAYDVLADFPHREEAIAWTEDNLTTLAGC